MPLLAPRPSRRRCGRRYARARTGDTRPERDPRSASSSSRSRSAPQRPDRGNELPDPADAGTDAQDQEDNEFRFQDLEKAAPRRAAPSTQPVDGGDSRIRRRGHHPGRPTPGSMPGPTRSASPQHDARPDRPRSERHAESARDVQLPGAIGNGSTPAPPGVETDQPDQTSLRRARQGRRLPGRLWACPVGRLCHAPRTSCRLHRQLSRSEKIADANFGSVRRSIRRASQRSGQTFLNAYQTYGKSPKAPEMLLKLGMSLAALDNTETACATLREVTKRYPKASRAVVAKVARANRSGLRC